MHMLSKNHCEPNHFNQYICVMVTCNFSVRQGNISQLLSSQPMSNCLFYVRLATTLWRPLWRSRRRDYVLIPQGGDITLPTPVKMGLLPRPSRGSTRQTDLVPLQIHHLRKRSSQAALNRLDWQPHFTCMDYSMLYPRTSLTVTIFCVKCLEFSTLNWQKNQLKSKFNLLIKCQMSLFKWIRLICNGGHRWTRSSHGWPSYFPLWIQT